MAQSNQDQEDLLNAVIASGLLNQYVYSKAAFDNAHDTTALHQAATENQELLVQVLRRKIEPYTEELMIHKFEEALRKSNGSFVLRTGDGVMHRVKIELENVCMTKTKQ